MVQGTENPDAGEKTARSSIRRKKAQLPLMRRMVNNLKEKNHE